MSQEESLKNELRSLIESSSASVITVRIILKELDALYEYGSTRFAQNASIKDVMESKSET